MYSQRVLRHAQHTSISFLVDRENIAELNCFIPPYAPLPNFLLAVFAAAAVSSVEHIKETCALTGETREYSRYFRVITSKPVYHRSWIEEVLTANGHNVPKPVWVRTMGDTWTLFGGMYRAHDRAPRTYLYNSFKLADLRKSFSEEELVTLATQFISGDKDAQQRAGDVLLDR